MRGKYVEPSIAQYLKYYQHGPPRDKKQRGGKLPFYRGDVYGQRGAGLGSIFAKLLGGIRGIINSTPAWVKTGVKEAVKQAGRTGMDIASEAVRAGSKDEWEKTAKQKAKEGVGELLATYGNKIKQQSGKGIKRGQQSVNKIISPVKRVRKAVRKTTTAAKKKQTRSKSDFLGTL
jgi:hypothetical protein